MLAYDGVCLLYIKASLCFCCCVENYISDCEHQNKLSNLIKYSMHTHTYSNEYHHHRPIYRSFLKDILLLNYEELHTHCVIYSYLQRRNIVSLNRYLHIEAKQRG